MSPYRLEFFRRGLRKQWYFRLRSTRNGEIILRSTDGYSRYTDAREIAVKVFPAEIVASSR